MKKEIHLRLIKRAVIAWFLAMIIALLIVLFLEYRTLGNTLLTSAVNQSSVFANLLSAYQKNPGESALVEIKRMAGSGLEQTSFLSVDLLDVNQNLITSLSLSQAAAAQEIFSEQGITLIPTKRAVGTWLFANKRIYQSVALPIYDSDEELTGYITGLYLVSLQDTKKIISRFILSAVLCVTAITLCAIFSYFGFLFMNNHLIRSIGELNRTTIFLIKKLGQALAKSDCANSDHNFRTLLYALNLAEKTKLPLEQKRTLIHGVFLHDIGMLPISTQVLHKDKELDENERKKLAHHPKDGSVTIKKFRWLRNAEQVIRFHHEKYDGNGYPDGAKHEKIPMVARIFSIADAFDALTSQRPYRDPVSLDESLDIMEMETGLQFDPVLLATFLEIAPELYESISSLDSKGLEKEVDKLLKKYLRYK